MGTSEIDPSKLRIVDEGWRDEILKCAANASEIQIVCPFIKEAPIRDIIGAANASKIAVITRLNAQDFFPGVSDISALRYLIGLKADVRAIKGLHSKLYIFDRLIAVLTSANLTAAALDKNKEFGAVLTDKNSVEGCVAYFEKLWGLVGSNIPSKDLDQCEGQLLKAKITGARETPSGLQDFGVSIVGAAGSSAPITIPAPSLTSATIGLYESPPSSFVKFFGTGDYRAPLDQPIWAEIEESGSHWACTSSKRHNQPVDGSVMFLTRTVDSQDYRIYGISLALRHVPGRDEASWGDINKRHWKAEWPYYVRIHKAIFIAGVLGNGISLREMMKALGHECFASTQRNFESGEGQTDPSQTLRQQHSRELTPKAHAWLLAEFERRFAQFGVVPEFDMQKLDRPIVADGYEIDVRAKAQILLQKTSRPVMLVFKWVVAAVAAWDGVIVATTKDRITIKAGPRPLQFAECEVQSQRIRFQIRDIDYPNSPYEVGRVADSHDWALRKFFFMDKDTEIEEVLKLLKRSYEDVT